MGFSVLGLLIVAKEHDGGASITGGIISILLGAAFLMAGCLHWKCWDQVQRGFQVEEDPAAADRVQRGIGIDQAGIDVDFSAPLLSGKRSN